MAELRTNLGRLRRRLRRKRRTVRRHRRRLRRRKRRLNRRRPYWRWLGKKRRQWRFRSRLWRDTPKHAHNVALGPQKWEPISLYISRKASV